MKIISWNIRGTKGIQKLRILKKRIKEDQPALLMLQETKSEGNFLQERLSKIWYRCKTVTTDVRGAAGGLAISWNPDKVSLSNFLATSYSISASFHHIDSGVKGVLTNVYGPSHPREKNYFLDSLEFLAGWVAQRHWVLGGDFNLITNLQEKKGGTRKLDPTAERFSQLIHQLKLVDTRTANGMFTWNNKRIGEHVVASRLDRFLLSESIVTTGGEHHALIIPTVGSDHWAISLTWIGLGYLTRKPFRFEHCWFEHPKFKEKVKTWWTDSATQGGQCMYRFQQRLKSLKGKIRIWNKEEFRNIFEDKKMIENQLRTLQEEVISHGYSGDLLEREKDLTSQLHQREKQEEIFWRQKSRTKWLKEGDRNTKFFHRSTIQRRSFNKISTLKKPDGESTTFRAEMESLLVDYFSDILAELGLDRDPAISEITAFIPRLITAAQNDLLSRPVSMEELSEGLNSMASDTAPGPDGFTINFFKQFWDMLKEDVLQIVESSRIQGSMLQAFNATFLTLIPKEEGADSPSLFRPISLCNVIYKLSSKVVANLLKPLLPTLISPEQSGFVEGRQILDGILLANEVAHSLKSTRKMGMMLKVDMAKAFDKLNWRYIKAILEAFGFSPDWINWCMGLITSSFFAILINGTPSKCFTPTRGIRQGDPLSPFIFILAAEGLGRLMKGRILAGRLRGLHLHEGSEVQSHQQFVDDTLLMTHSAVQEARELKAILQTFATASGMEVNPRKSRIYFFNTPPITQRNIVRILGFQSGTLPTRYLGAPLSEKIIRQASWQDLLDKIKSRLNDWTFRSLNFPSRLTLVKSILQAMPVYLFSVLAAPKSVIKQIKTIQRTFLWGGSPEKMKWPLVDWKSLCTPKREGGLGLRDPLTTNEVFNAKIWWKWVTHDQEPWARLWHAKYARLWDKQSLIRYDESPPGSFIWNAASTNRSLITRHCFWEIRNGTQAKFWEDAWQQCPKLKDSLVNQDSITAFHYDLKIQVRDYLTGQHEAQDFRHWLQEDWWNQKLQGDELNSIQEELNKRKIRVHQGPDKLRWGVKSGGYFSIKEAFQFLNAPPHPTPEEAWKKVWDKALWPKVSLFLWLVMKGRILT